MPSKIFSDLWECLQMGYKYFQTSGNIYKRGINISQSFINISKGLKRFTKGYEHFVKLYKYFLGLADIQKSDINIDRTLDKFLGLGKYKYFTGILNYSQALEIFTHRIEYFFRASKIITGHCNIPAMHSNGPLPQVKVKDQYWPH